MTKRGHERRDRSRELLTVSRIAAQRLRRAWQSGPVPTLPAGVLSGASFRGRLTGVAVPGRPALRDTEQALSAICADLALRDLNLVDRLLGRLEDLEAREEDSERLAELYHLDHLAARLRRNAENLRVLAGHDASLTASGNQPLVDVIRAAMSPIDHYDRVTIGSVVSLGVVGFAAEDVGRLLSELLDNATKSSPPSMPVRVGVHLTERGRTLVRVEDDGIGLPPDRLSDLNRRLTDPPALDDDAVRHMGLAVVRRLAERHEIRVWLEERHPHGTTASILLPAALVCELPKAGWSGTRTVASAPAGAPLPVAAHRAAGDPTEGAGRGGAIPTRWRPPVPAGVTANLQPGPEAARGQLAPGALPRRVPGSLRGGSDRGPAPPPSPGSAARREQLLADLDAFSEGERAARQEPREV